MIVETYDLTATNTDILAAPSRLAAVPYAGTLICEFQATESDDTNNYEVTIQLPNGDVPLDSVRIPDGVISGAINANDKYAVSFKVPQGGHVGVSATETGTAILKTRFTLMP